MRAWVRAVRSHPGAVTWLAPVAVAVVCAAIAWLRLSPTARDTLWAEDGSLFLQTAAGGRGWSSLLHPYAGYLHLVPRLEAALTVGAVPVQGWALSMTALSCAVAGLVATVVFACSRDLVPWMPARVVLAALTVLTPLAAREVLGNAANVHSLLFWGAFWALLHRPRGRTATVLLTGFVLLAALTEVQTLFLLPLLLRRRRDRGTWPVKAALLAGATAQLVAAMTSTRPQTGMPQVGLASLAQGWLINAVATSWVPIGHVGAVLAAIGPGLAVTALASATALTVVLVAGTRSQRALSLLMVAASVVVWSAGVIANPEPWYDYAAMTPAQLEHAWLSRYGVVPAMMLLALLPLAAAVLHARPRRPARVLAVGILALVVMVTGAQAGENLSRRSGGPAWQPQLAAAAVQCGAPVARVANLRETLGWHVEVPCGYLDPLGDLLTGSAPDRLSLGSRLLPH